MQSIITLNIEINHNENIDSAQEIARQVAMTIANRAGVWTCANMASFGRSTSIGGEQGSEYNGVRVTLVSAAVESKQGK